VADAGAHEGLRAEHALQNATAEAIGLGEAVSAAVEAGRSINLQVARAGYTHHSEWPTSSRSQWAVSTRSRRPSLSMSKVVYAASRAPYEHEPLAAVASKPALPLPAAHRVGIGQTATDWKNEPRIPPAPLLTLPPVNPSARPVGARLPGGRSPKIPFLRFFHTLEPDHDVAVLAALETVFRKRGAEDVAAQPIEAASCRAFLVCLRCVLEVQPRLVRAAGDSCRSLWCARAAVLSA
jgi:hypothetical protein